MEDRSDHWTTVSLQIQRVFKKRKEKKRNLLVSIVLRLHCSSTPPCFLPDTVKGISNTNRRMLWLLSKSVFLSTSSFSSRYGVTCVTWMYAYLESRSLGFIWKDYEPIKIQVYTSFTLKLNLFTKPQSLTLPESWIIFTFSWPNLSEYSFRSLWEISDKGVNLGSL